jgi:DNA polymerase-1
MASAPPPPRLFLVDGYAFIYRAFFALGQQPLRNARGENTSIAKGVSEFLKRLFAAHAPDYLGWVHDAGASGRDTLYPAYKATRERLDPDAQADFDTGLERTEQLLRAYRLPILAVEGFEADDVIGTLARRAAAQDINVVVVSGDKDLLQLVAPRIRVLNPYHGRPGQTTEKWYDVDNVSERLGVGPHQVVDYLALLGDTSDNVPGVKGIGEKGARELLARWGSLDAILAHLDEVTPPRAQKALREHLADARLSRELVTLRYDIDIPLDLPALAVQEPDWGALRDLFVDLGFRTAARDAGARATAGPAAEREAAPEPGTDDALQHMPRDREPPPGLADQPGDDGERVDRSAYRIIDTPAALAELVARCRAAGRVALDTETELEPGAPPVVNPLRARLVSIALAVAPGEAYYLPFGHRLPAQAGFDDAAAPRNLPPLDDPACAPLVALLEDPAVAKVGQNAKYDLLVLRRHGVTVRGLAFDTILASYLLDPGRRSHGLDALSVEFLKHTMISYEEVCGKGKAQIPFAEVPVDRARDYSAEDADVTLRLADRFTPALTAAGLRRLLDDLELPLVHVLAEMEWTGVAIDLAWFASLKERFAAERKRAEQALWEAAGEEFNVNSTPQLRRILFEKLGLPVKKRTATGASTDASVLQELADEGHTLPVLLMEYRELAKLESTYIDTLPALVNPRTGRLHTSYSQTIAATGRISSSDPNLQNIPIRSAVGKDIRRGFVPRAGWVLVAADYSQIELRLLAHLSGDDAFVSAFNAGGDIHRQTAALIFGVPLDAVTGEMRARAKTINFATIYGQGAFSLAKQLKIEQAEAKGFITGYFERFAGVRRYLDTCVERAKATGYAETLFGRRRFIPELADRNFNVRAFGERIAQNSPIQGSAADLIKRAMLRVAAALTRDGLAAKLLLQVHDELVFECPPGEIAALEPVIRREMEGAATLAVPLVVDIGKGSNWVEAKA